MLQSHIIPEGRINIYMKNPTMTPVVCLEFEQLCASSHILSKALEIISFHVPHALKHVEVCADILYIFQFA